jgi:hypothetical protein
MKSKFILHDLFHEPMNYEQFKHAKEQYLLSITDHPLEKLDHSDTVDLIKMTKRTLGKIGPYRSLTVFESLNRIASDLVLLSGAEKLFENEIKDIGPKEICLKMGNIAGYDIIIETTNGDIIYGEAFNSAPSFCKTKMRDSINKLITGDKSEEVLSKNKAVIICNKDVEEKLTLYTNKALEKLKSDQGFQLHTVYCDYEEVYRAVTNEPQY